MEDLSRETITYLWDNYVQLSGASKIILIGHGPGCQPLIGLLDRRSVGIMKSVKAVIQVVGPQKNPSVPTSSDDIRNWYRKNSFVIVPTTHPVLNPNARAKDLRKHGAFIPIDETRQIKLITTGLPAIQDIVGQATGRKPANNISDDIAMTKNDS